MREGPSVLQREMVTHEVVELTEYCDHLVATDYLPPNLLFSSLGGCFWGVSGVIQVCFEKIN